MDVAHKAGRSQVVSFPNSTFYPLESPIA